MDSEFNTSVKLYKLLEDNSLSFKDPKFIENLNLILNQHSRSWASEKDFDIHLFLFCLLKPLLLGGLRGNSSVYGATSYVKTLIVFDPAWDKRTTQNQYRIIVDDFLVIYGQLFHLLVREEIIVTEFTFHNKSWGKGGGGITASKINRLHPVREILLAHIISNSGWIIKSEPYEAIHCSSGGLDVNYQLLIMSTTPTYLNLPYLRYLLWLFHVNNRQFLFKILSNESEFTDGGEEKYAVELHFIFLTLLEFNKYVESRGSNPIYFNSFADFRGRCYYRLTHCSPIGLKILRPLFELEKGLECTHDHSELKRLLNSKVDSIPQFMLDIVNITIEESSPYFDLYQWKNPGFDKYEYYAHIHFIIRRQTDKPIWYARIVHFALNGYLKAVSIDATCRGYQHLAGLSNLKEIINNLGLGNINNKRKDDLYQLVGKETLDYLLNPKNIDKIMVTINKYNNNLEDILDELKEEVSSTESKTQKGKLIALICKNSSIFIDQKSILELVKLIKSSKAMRKAFKKSVMTIIYGARFTTLADYIVKGCKDIQITLNSRERLLIAKFIIAQPTTKAALFAYKHIRIVGNRKSGKRNSRGYTTKEEMKDCGSLENGGKVPTINVMHFWTPDGFEVIIDYRKGFRYNKLVRFEGRYNYVRCYLPHYDWNAKSNIATKRFPVNFIHSLDAYYIRLLCEALNILDPQVKIMIIHDCVIVKIEDLFTVMHYFPCIYNIMYSEGKRIFELCLGKQEKLASPIPKCHGIATDKYWKGMATYYPNNGRISANYTCFARDLNIEHSFKDLLSDVKTEEIIVVLRDLVAKHAQKSKVGVNSPEIVKKIFEDE